MISGIPSRLRRPRCICDRLAVVEDCLNCSSRVFRFPRTASSIATQTFALPRPLVLGVLVLSAKEGGHRAAAPSLCEDEARSVFSRYRPESLPEIESESLSTFLLRERWKSVCLPTDLSFNFLSSVKSLFNRAFPFIHLSYVQSKTTASRNN